MILEEGGKVEYGERLDLLTNSESRFSRLNRTGLQAVMV
jgi:hypothetical protein